METWPSTLPAIQHQLAQEPVPAVVRTEMDNEIPRQRQRFTTELFNQSVNWFMSEAQYQIFRKFVKVTLHSGCDFFYTDLPFGNGLETVQARIVNGVYKAVWQETGNGWSVSATLEIIDPPVIA